MFPLSKKNLTLSILLFSAVIPSLSFANGIVLGGTRIIYPLKQKQVSVSVRNTSEVDRFMVQSWIDDANEKKTSDFIMTPPLFVSNPKDENSLRVMYAGPSLPTDRETLYYLTAKSIPAVDKEKMKGQNVLLLATATRIKLFVRPDGLQPEVSKAPSLITFSRRGSEISISNPTPYFITMVHIKAGEKDIDKNLMVAPKASASFPSPSTSELSFRVINDYGGMSEVIKAKIN